MQTDVLIIGQGLAGSTLAWRLAEQGVDATVVDRGGVDACNNRSASRVAAGLVTPVIGKRMTVSEDFDAIYQSTLNFYMELEAKTGHDFLDQTPSLRIFQSQEEREKFVARGFESRAALATEEELAAIGLAADKMLHGGFSAPGSIRLNTDLFLDATKQWLVAEGRFVVAALDPNHDLVPGSAGVSVDSAGITSKVIVLCQGHTSHPVRWLDGVDFAPAKGEVLTIETSELDTERVVRRGVWVAPCESGTHSRYRVGSTTEWHDVGSGVTLAGREELLSKLHEMGLKDFNVVAHEAGVRPATPSRQPALGFSTEEPRIGWFNGLGAKGTLWAPYFAEKMAEMVVKSLG